MNSAGYTVIEGFLGSEQTALLRSKLHAAVIAFEPNESPQSVLDRYLLHDLVARDMAFCSILDDARLGILDEWIGGNWILYAATSSSLPPQGTNYGRRIHHDAGDVDRAYRGRIGVILALDAFTLENGATEVLPGSHLMEGVTDAQFERDCEPLTCKAGALIAFDGRLYHRSGINRTDGWRHAMTMNFCRSWMRQRMDWPRMVPEDFVQRLGPQGRKAIGFKTPASMEEFWAHR